MAGFKNPDLHERQEAAAKAKKAALQKFLAKAADPALAERLTARSEPSATPKRPKPKPAMPNARLRRNATPRYRPSVTRPSAPSVNWRCKPSKKRPGTPAMPPANPNRSASN
jgi:hypothetical protein